MSRPPDVGGRRGPHGPVCARIWPESAWLIPHLGWWPRSVKPRGRQRWNRFRPPFRRGDSKERLCAREDWGPEAPCQILPASQHSPPPQGRPIPRVFPEVPRYKHPDDRGEFWKSEQFEKNACLRYCMARSLGLWTLWAALLSLLFDWPLWEGLHTLLRSTHPN